MLNYLKFLGSRAGEYLTHRVVPEKKGKGKDHAVITHSVLEEFGSCVSLEVVLMDNTATNHRPYWWLACLFREAAGQETAPHWLFSALERASSQLPYPEVGREDHLWKQVCWRHGNAAKCQGPLQKESGSL